MDEAEQRLSDARVHLIVSDMRLPEGTGLDLVRWVRAERSVRTTPCLAITGYDRLPATAAHGFDAYMRKPINLDKFCDLAVALAHA